MKTRTNWLWWSVIALVVLRANVLAFYDPGAQRWINCDPIKEAGGINLYGFIDNSPLDSVDYFGWSNHNRPTALTCAIVPGLKTDLYKKEYYANRQPPDWVPSTRQISLDGGDLVQYKTVTPSGKWKDAGSEHRYYFKE